MRFATDIMDGMMQMMKCPLRTIGQAGPAPFRGSQPPRVAGLTLHFLLLLAYPIHFLSLTLCLLAYPLRLQVVLAYGAESDRKLGIPGEGAGNVLSAREFVWWYNGHTDATQLPVNLAGVKSVAVSGDGYDECWRDGQ